MIRTRTVNDIGIGYKGINDERMEDIRIYPDGTGTVQLWVEININGRHLSVEAMQYLTPQEAMDFSCALERCAIQALRDSATLRIADTPTEDHST